MNVLMVGDVVGPGAVAYRAGRLTEFRRARDVDLVIANAENCAVTASTPYGGFRMTVALVEQLLESGIDVVTSGNHGWDGPEADDVHRHARVLRPHNFPEGLMGKGIATLEVRGEQASVLNLGSPTAVMPGALPPYDSWSAAGLEGTVIVDFHGDSAWEKMEFATAVDGRVAAPSSARTPMSPP